MFYLIPLIQPSLVLHSSCLSQVAEISKSKAIIAFTTSGSTALRVSKLRPTVPIIAVTYSMETARWLAMVSNEDMTFTQYDVQSDACTSARYFYCCDDFVLLRVIS